MYIPPNIVSKYFMITNSIGFESTKDCFRLVFKISDSTSYHIPITSFTFEGANFWDCTEIKRDVEDQFNDIIDLFNQEELVNIFNNLNIIILEAVRVRSNYDAEVRNMRTFQNFIFKRLDFDKITLSINN